MSPTGTAPCTGAPSAAAPPSGLPPALGGTRGLIDGGLPPLVFVAVNAVFSASSTRSTALAAAIGAATATGLGIVGLRLVRKESLRQAVGGLAGLAVAVLFAATSGQARGFFLPGIIVDAAYGLAFAGSALVGYPLVGTLYGLLYRRRDWRDDPRLRRMFVLATFGWSGVFAVRAGVQVFLYREDLPGLLAIGKVLLGWPLTIAAVGLTLAAVRRASRRAPPAEAGPPPVEAPGPQVPLGDRDRLPPRRSGGAVAQGHTAPDWHPHTPWGYAGPSGVELAR